MARLKQLHELIFPDTVLSVVHDDEGWRVQADRPGEAPFLMGGLEMDAASAHRLAGVFAAAVGGCKVEPLRLN